eukprot:2130518-Karenia_brevis.AAC.1
MPKSLNYWKSKGSRRSPNQRQQGWRPCRDGKRDVGTEDASKGNTNSLSGAATFTDAAPGAS